jgi:serine/threonine protein kinase
MIDKAGAVKIIDFGSTRVAGIAEIGSPQEREAILGTAQYTAPEYFLGEAGTAASDLFSLGVIAYQMLSGRLPYGAEVAKSRTVSAQRRLRYRSVLDDDREIPGWIDGALERAVHPDPGRRYESLSELVYDLRHPNDAFVTRTGRSLLDRYPVLFWKSVAVVLAAVVFVLLFVHFGIP